MRLLLLAVLACVLAAVVVNSTSRTALAHGGGIDSKGCHNNNKAGNYHCHQGTCAGQTFSSKAAASACHL